MKKIIIAALAAIVSLGAAAKTADELRIYINPGHGSWTANDRPMDIIGHEAHSRKNTDTLSFFESNTNLRKGFGVLEKLASYGLKFDRTLNQTGDRHQIGAARDLSNNIVMSHVKCGPYHDDNGTASQLGANTPADLEYYNRSLSEIAYEVDVNNFDMFISIHSNAVDSSGKWLTTNFPIILYRGFDNVDTKHEGINNEHTRTSKAMATAVWAHHVGDLHGTWTAYSATNPNLRGDCNYYASPSLSARGYYGYLGVLKHGVPGFLVEGYFHQYAPAALRHMNWDVDYIEGYNYAHGIADYFKLNKEKTGDIYGIVRDAHERFDHPKYNAVPGTLDMYKPLNGVTVTLKKDGNTVATYTTDDQYNGAYVFKDVEPGEYTITYAAEGYKTPKATKVTVKAATIEYPHAEMESDDYVPPTVEYFNYPDEIAGTAFSARDEYNFKAAITDKELAELAGKTVKRFISRGNQLYVLAFDADKTPYIYIYNAIDGTLLNTLSTEGAEGTELAISDIALTADNQLLACNYELCHFADGNVQSGETRGECNIYRWNEAEDSDMLAGAPYVWASTQLSGNFNRALTGASMAYSGTTDEGTVYLTSETIGADTRNTRISYVSIIAGKAVSGGYFKMSDEYNAEFLNHKLLGDYTMTLSPLRDKSLIINSPAVAPRQFGQDSGILGIEEGTLAEGLVDNRAAQAGFFIYGGKSYMVAADLDADGKSVGVKLIDITDGLANATAVTTNGTTAEAAEGLVATAGRGVTTLNALDKVASASVAMYMLRGNKLSIYTTDGVLQPQGKREFAYDINVEVTGEDTPEAQYTVTFKSTGDAVDANIILTNQKDANDVVRHNVGALTKGQEYTCTFTKAGLTTDPYTIGVEVISKTIPEPGIYFEDPNGVTKRGGIVSINDPEAGNIGYTLVATGSNNGVKIYAPDGTVSGPFFKGDSRLDVNNQSSLFRADQRNGMAVFSDWSDKGAGYWVIDPTNPVDMTQLLGGARQGTQGSYAYEGTIIGGGSSCVAFQGHGEDQKMYSFLEDYPAGNTAGAQNAIYCYNIGNAEQITTIPDKKYDSFNGAGRLANQNVDITAVENGFFASQCRSEGNNVSGCAGFFFSDNDGNVLMESSELPWMTSCNSGFAISADRTLAAIGQYECISVASVKWNKGCPEFTHLYDIPTGTITWAQLKIDAGHNIHAYLREAEGYKAYSIPDAAPASVVLAPSKYIINPAVDGIQTVEAGAAPEADAVYYNLSGIRIDTDALSTGIYIKVRGTKATKVVVK